MKMTKRFEKKLKAFAKRHNLETNFSWDIGWFDFLYGHIKLGSIRFVGYNLCEDKPSLRYNIYCATMFTRICYAGTHHQPSYWGGHTVSSNHTKGDIWTPEDGDFIDYISDFDSKSDTMTKFDNETEESIIAFFESCVTRVMNAKTLFKMEEKLQDMKKDFEG